MAAAPKLPGSIKVGYQTVALELASREDLIDAYGDCNHEKQRIRIGDWLKPQQAAETLIHELLHAVWPNRWSHVGDIEETLVTGLAPNIAGVWRDNPAIVAWLSWALK